MHVNGELEHRGTVLAVNTGWVDVAIQPEEACGSCKAKSACGMSEQGEKVVSVATELTDAYSVGDQVTVSVSRRMGFKAVFLAYVIPFVLLLVSLLVLVGQGVGEGASGLISLGILALYYMVLYLFRDRIGREIVFKISKKS